MKIKLFFMLALAIAMLTSCGNGNKEEGAANGKGKAVATYTFSDGQVITKDKKGDYKSSKGYVDQVNGDIVVVMKTNFENFNDPRKYVKRFSAVYNITQADPILSFDEYYAVATLYPKSGLILATKAGNSLGRTLYSLRTFDGNTFVFPLMGYMSHLWYTDVNSDPLLVNDDTGEITTPGRLNKDHTFTLKDVKPEWIKDKKIYFNFDWYTDLSQTKSGGEYIPFKYEGYSR